MTWPANWGLGMYTGKELRECLAHVEAQLAGDLPDGDRRRLTARREAVLAEIDERALREALEDPGAPS